LVILVSVSGCVGNGGEEGEKDTITTLPPTTTPQDNGDTPTPEETSPPITTPAPYDGWDSFEGDWTEVVTGGFNDKNNIMTSDIIIQDGSIYVATMASPSSTMYTGSTKYGGDIWKSDDGVDWEMIIQPGFGNTDNIWIKLVAFNGKLYATTFNTSTGSEIWVSEDGEEFVLLCSGGLGDTENVEFYPIVYDDKLILISQNPDTGVEIWVSEDGEEFAKVVDGGMGEADNHGVTNYGVVFGEHLYVGTINSASGGEIWRTSDGKLWGRVADEGIESSAYT
jgi:hypothetical protein